MMTLEELVEGSELHFNLKGMYKNDVCRQQYLDLLRRNIEYLLETKASILSIKLAPKVKAKIVEEYNAVQ